MHAVLWAQEVKNQYYVYVWNGPDFWIIGEANMQILAVDKCATLIPTQILVVQIHFKPQPAENMQLHVPMDPRNIQVHVYRYK